MAIKFTANPNKGIVEELIDNSTPSTFTFNTESTVFSGSIVSLAGFTGSLLGTASYSITSSTYIQTSSSYADFALTSSFANTYTKPIILTNNTVWVDSDHGDDTTGTREDYNRPFKTVNPAIAATITGDTVKIRPGNYNITPIVMPANVCLQGEDVKHCVLTYVPTGSCTLVTMAPGAVLTGLNLYLTCSGHYNLTGVYWPPGTPRDTYVKDVRLHVSNEFTATAGTSSLVGYHVKVAGDQHGYHFSDGSVVHVYSTGAGEKRGVLMDSATTCSMNNTDVFIRAYNCENVIGVELNNPLGMLRYKSGTVEILAADLTASNADISNTAGQLRVGSGVTLVDSSCRNRSFTPIGQASMLTFADSGNVTPGLFLRPGSGVASVDEGAVQLSLEGTYIIQYLKFRLNIAPGVPDSVTVVVRINGVDTDLRATATGTDLQAEDEVHAIVTHDDDLISLHILDQPAGVATDILASVNISSW